MYDKNSYKLTFKNNFDALFDSTFNTTEYTFSGKNRNEHTDFNREEAIQNAVSYFQELGINVHICFENEQEKDLFSKLIYKLISNELLPVIFNTDDNREKRKVIDIEMDDITPDFKVIVTVTN